MDSPSDQNPNPNGAALTASTPAAPLNAGANPEATATPTTGKKAKQTAHPTPSSAAEAAKSERVRADKEKGARNEQLENAGLVQPGAPITSYEHERAVYPEDATPTEGEDAAEAEA